MRRKPSTYAEEAKAAGREIIAWTAERSGRLKDGGGWYFHSIVEPIHQMPGLDTRSPRVPAPRAFGLRFQRTPGSPLGFVDDRFDPCRGWGRDQLQGDPAQEAKEGHGHRLGVGVRPHRAVADPFADLVGEQTPEVEWASINDIP